MTLQTLKKTILSQNEADLYELLLNIGESNAANIIKKSGLKRATVYKTLYALEAKKLITSFKKNKKIHFKPQSPDNLLNLTEEKLANLNTTKNDLLAILPDLKTNYLLSTEKPIVSTFEGLKGLKNIYLDTLKEKKGIFAVLQTAEVDKELYDWLTNSYSFRRAQLQIPAKVIISSGKWSAEYIEENSKFLRETRLVSDKLFPFKHEVDIYGDKVAFINYKKGEALLGIIIHHPQIASTMKAFFDLAWIGAKNQ